MKVAIIKLGALGDVVRTLPLIPAIKEKYPNSEITWVTKQNAKDILKNNPQISKVLTIPTKLEEEFDILYNFDIEKEATDLAKESSAKKKLGFSAEGNFPISFNLGAEYYLNTLFDDDLKKYNKKTYQEMMFEAAELLYKKQHEKIYLTGEDEEYANNFLRENNLVGERIIGIHIGASPRWPSKKWHKENLKEFVKEASMKGYSILLLGGPNEVKEIKDISQELEKSGIKIFSQDPNCSLLEFSSLVNICEKIVSADSLALHIALALKKPTLGLFFCTPYFEVEGYGLLKKIHAQKLYEFFPEKMDQYSEELTKSISSQRVLEELEKLGKINVVNGIIFSQTKNKFLIIKRKGEAIHADKWLFPGGIVKDHESYLDALRREIKEEVGLTMKELKEKISEFTYLRADGKQTLGECFLIEVADFSAKTGDEIEEFRWVDLEEFIKLDFLEGLDEEIKRAMKFI